MYCQTDFGNPHFGYVGFDDFYQAFILQFQVQTLSTWYEYGYMSEQALGWYTQFYYVCIICIVGFVVAQLFISVVCFGFESLTESLEKPVFSPVLLPEDEDEEEKIDDLAEETMCCAGQKEDPLAGAEHESGAGTLTGIRVDVKFEAYKYAPYPLDVSGFYPPAKHVNPLSEIAGDKNHFSEAETDDLSHPPGPNISGEPESQPEAADLQGDAAANEHLGQGSGVGIQMHDQQCEEATAHFAEEERLVEWPALQTFPTYQRFVAAVKASNKASETLVSFVPAKHLADNSTGKDAIELEFDLVQDIELVDELRVWSDHTLAGLKQMIYEQEKIENGKVCEFLVADPTMRQKLGITDTDALNLDTRVEQLLPSWPPVDEDGRKDAITIPSIELKLRFKIKLDIVLLTHPELDVLTLHLCGDETIGMVESLVLHEIEARQWSVVITNIQSRFDEAVLDKHMSLWRACLENIDGFSPLVSNPRIIVTCDSLEGFVCSPPFGQFIMAAIAANTVFLGMEHYEAAEGFNVAQGVADWIFNTIFFFEMIIKIVCLKGPKNYLRPYSNRFDFVLVMSAVVGIIMNLIGVDGSQLAVLKLFRLFRALRVARLLRRFESVRIVLDAALGSLRPVFNIMLVMTLILTIFGCLGMQAEPPPPLFTVWNTNPRFCMHSNFVL